MKLLYQNKAYQDSKLRTIIIALALLLLVVIIGITGFTFIEGYTLTEAFFMTIITISTVGFREVHVLSDAGRIFTAFLIIFSFGIFAYAATTLTRYTVDGIFRNYYKDNKVKQKIKKLRNHVIICGYGRNGKQASLELAEHDQTFVIIDNNESVIEKIRMDSKLLYVFGDATHDNILLQSSIKEASALITTLPLDADNLFIVLTAKVMNPDLLIISRASDDYSDVKLKRAGANNVIMPDKIGGQRMAKLVTQPDVVEFLESIMLQGVKDVTLEEIVCDNMSSCFTNKSIKELDIRNESGANIIGLKREDNSYIINPTPDVILSSKDKIFALGTTYQIERLKAILEM